VLSHGGENISINQSQAPTSTDVDDDTYMKLLQAEQEHTRTRWTAVTFFMSISFALFGFSFQKGLVPLELLVMRISALLIYWFAVALFWRFATFSEYLGRCRDEMEDKGHTSIHIRDKVEKARASGKGFVSRRSGSLVQCKRKMVRHWY
jgi:hypothetical protein